VLALVLAKVQNLESSIVLTCCLQFALNADEALAGRVNGKFAKVRRPGIDLANQVSGSWGVLAADERELDPYDISSCNTVSVINRGCVWQPTISRVTARLSAIHAEADLLTICQP
jgi:hypothetical protein